MYPNKALIVDFQIALEKAAKYCAYQERCQWDLEKKMMEWNIDTEIREEVLVEMIQQNFINEERYAKAFTNGKVNIKRWGRIKIKNELRARKISDYSIRKAFEEIDEDKYVLNLQHLLQHKDGIIYAKDDFERRMKLFQYISSKGYETQIINDELDNYGITRWYKSIE